MSLGGMRRAGRWPRPCWLWPAVALSLALPWLAAAEPGRITLAEARARHADPASRYAELDGVQVHYTDEGQGPALLLVHGSMGDVADWDGWVAALSGRYRVIRFDLPGFGLSGPIAFRYAATRRDRVTALLIVNSAGIEYGRQSVDPASGKKDYYEGATAALVSAEFVRTSLSRAYTDASRVDDPLVRRKTDFMNVEGRDREGAAMIATFERGDPLRVLRRVQAPVLVMWGGASRALSQKTADDFASAVVNAKVVWKHVEPGGGHMMHREQPVTTARAAGEFLDAFVGGANGR
jgi:pimeloyl-ACP methyl ester carboxylesterase